MADEKGQKQLKVIEFYSGIGGMHFALKGCKRLSTQVVAAIDINTTANQVYCHNFPETVLLNRNIEGIKLEEFIKFDADVLMMSPPCQPFTRQGLQKASSDARTKSFLHIMDVLRRLPKRPTYILMENVKGFETSNTREDFVKTLEETNYTSQEFLLTPMQFGIPNSRLRYFLIAVQKPMMLPFEITNKVLDHLPVIHVGCQEDDSHPRCLPQHLNHPRNFCSNCSVVKTKDSTTITSQYTAVEHNSHVSSHENNMNDAYYGLNNCQQQNTTEKDTSTSTELTGRDFSVEHFTAQNSDLGISFVAEERTRANQEIRNFLEKSGVRNLDEFLLPEDVLRRKVLLTDIVQEGCNHSCCFTKGYHHKVEGTGSILQENNIDAADKFSRYNNVNEEDRCDLLKPLRLRYFTPQEIANIHCFPDCFDFPETISTKQQYRLLGNSLNVFVVTNLVNILFASKK